MFSVKLLHENLENKYDEIENHYDNATMKGDSGVDLFMPENIIVPANARGFTVDLCVKAVYRQHSIINFIKYMFGCNNTHGFYLYPRSSISKTPLRLSNSVGIIDSGYRGNIIAKVDNLSDEDYTISEHTALFQLVAPDLSNIINIDLFENDEYCCFIDKKTLRNDGAFGSSTDSPFLIDENEIVSNEKNKDIVFCICVILLGLALLSYCINVFDNLVLMMIVLIITFTYNILSGLGNFDIENINLRQ